MECLTAIPRVERSGDLLRIYSADLKVLLVTHTVTWSRTDSFCEGQYESLVQPEESLQHLFKHRFYSFQNPRRIFPLPNLILTRRTRYEGNNL